MRAAHHSQAEHWLMQELQDGLLDTLLRETRGAGIAKTAEGGGRGKDDAGGGGAQAARDAGALIPLRTSVVSVQTAWGMGVSHR